MNNWLFIICIFSFLSTNISAASGFTAPVKCNRKITSLKEGINCFRYQNFAAAQSIFKAQLKKTKNKSKRVHLYAYLSFIAIKNKHQQHVKNYRQKLSLLDPSFNLSHYANSQGITLPLLPPNKKRTTLSPDKQANIEATELLIENNVQCQAIKNSIDRLECLMK
ncbi:MAG: hypothetical protein KAG28_06540 [Cocleimonas sp.]|nr:hypothetical protein [Cocleimonas sp.]